MSRSKIVRKLLAGFSAALGEETEPPIGWGPVLLALNILGATGFLLLLAEGYKRLTAEQADLRAACRSADDRTEAERRDARDKNQQPATSGDPHP